MIRLATGEASAAVVSSSSASRSSKGSASAWPVSTARTKSRSKTSALLAAAPRVRNVRRMTIRPLTESHAAAAVALWREAGLTRPWNDAEADFLRAVRGPESAVLGVTGDDDAVLATAMVGHDGHRGWVYYLAVAAGHRRQGVAGRLVQACEDWVRGRDVPKIQLMVRRDNEEVVAFYERLGYEPSDVVVLGRRLDT